MIILYLKLDNSNALFSIVVLEKASCSNTAILPSSSRWYSSFAASQGRSPESDMLSFFFLPCANVRNEL